MASENGKGRLFEYVVLHHPRPKKNGDGEEIREPSEIIVDVERVLVRNQQEALILASREIPESYLDRLDEVEIAVRPF